MNCFNFETDYLDLLEHILLKGEDKVDRTGVGTRALFAHSLNIELGHGFGFPLLTTKKMPFKSIVSELLWFIEGSSDERRLERRLVAEFEGDVDNALARLTPASHAAAVRLLSLAEAIKGYGRVKEAAANEAAMAREAALRQFEAEKAPMEMAA